MANPERFKHSKRGYLTYQTNIIYKLLNDEEYNSAQKALNDLLKKYPNDDLLKILQARLFMCLGYFENAIDYLEDTDIDKSFRKLTALYLKTENDKKLYPLYLKYYKDSLDKIEHVASVEYKEKLSFYSARLVLLKRYGDLDESKINIEKLTFTDKQIINYDEETAIVHILKNHTSNYMKGKTKFYDNIDIKDLYYKAKEFINENMEKAKIYDGLIDSYVIYFPKCGVEYDGIECNHIMVKSIINTDQIMTIYPFVPKYSKNILYFDDKKDLDISKSKIKVKSGLERFNEKYNKN